MTQHAKFAATKTLPILIPSNLFPKMGFLLKSPSALNMDALKLGTRPYEKCRVCGAVLNKKEKGGVLDLGDTLKSFPPGI